MNRIGSSVAGPPALYAPFMTKARQSGLPFAKMHGAGNDFVVIDARARNVAITAELAKAMGDRHKGVGFDQLAVIEPSKTADFRLLFWNSDGSTSAACGNATRCIAAHEMDLTGQNSLQIDVLDRTLEARLEGNATWVNMGRALTRWDQVPLAQVADTNALPLDGAPLATSMGNPHCSFFVEEAEAVDLATLGPSIEHNPLFPERTNVQVVSPLGPDRFRVRVWERGAGLTLASGSSACAVTHAAHRSGRAGTDVTLEMDGGTLRVRIEGGDLWLTGPTAYLFDGMWRDG